MPRRCHAIVSVMSSSRCAVRVHRAAFFITLALGLGSLPFVAARAQDHLAARDDAAQPPRSGDVIELLVQQATQVIEDRYARPLGHVAERRRDRVLVVPLRVPPSPGTVLEALRPAEGDRPEHVVSRLEVIQSEAGFIECRERDRVGRAHTEPGDAVRRPVGSTRLLLAPCVSLVDVAPEIPQVIGEKLRAALLRSTLLAVVDSPEAERRAEAAYLSSAAAEFTARQTNVDEIVFPVLLQTTGKMVLNLEYYSVERGRAIDIDVVATPLDDLMRAWLRAGRSSQSAPPGFRRLPAQTRPWRIVALGAGPAGQLVAIDRDSVHVLRFEYPGLRVRFGASLGAHLRARRDPWSVLVTIPDSLLQEAPTDSIARLYLLSDDRKPQVLVWETSAESPPVVKQAGEIAPALELLWPGRRPDTRWWPGTGHRATALVPCFVDLDGDGLVDRMWSEPSGVLSVRLQAQRAPRSFPGFGDVKAGQEARKPNARPVLWLTDPVWHGDPDRLHQAELVGSDLQLLWSSESFEGTLVALASLDLNGDGVADLAAAEALEGGTRLHAYLAIGGGAGQSVPVGTVGR
jgi:hypothetical protein